METVLDRGADANARDKNGDTPLHLVARDTLTPPYYGVAKIALLVDRGANFRARNDAEENACQLVEQNDDLAITIAYDLLCR